MRWSASSAKLRHDALTEEVRHYARRHLLDTVGVMIAGAGGDDRRSGRDGAGGGATRRLPYRCPAARGAPICSTPLFSAAPPRMASSSMTVTRQGLGASRLRRHSERAGASASPSKASGKALIEAIVAGYETITAIGRAVPSRFASPRISSDWRSVGVRRDGAAAKLRGLTAQQIAHALGIAASSAAGLFAFVNGGGDIKRLHAGHAAREGMQAALLAEQGVEGPPDVIEARDGFMQAFAFGRPEKARAITLPPAAPFGITDCYIKPYRLLPPHPAGVEALFGLLQRREHRDRGRQARRGRDL